SLSLKIPQPSRNIQTQKKSEPNCPALLKS
ncbi:MAG: hypothetical protein ACI9AF_000138, partial [Granulosicoccus sp.]